VPQVVITREFEGMPGHVSLWIVIFSEHGGRTLLTHNTVYQSVEDRDLDLRSGMEEAPATRWTARRSFSPGSLRWAGDQRRGITRILSSPDPGLPRPSRLLVVHHSEPSGARTTARSRP
jgi:hypothetical protein